MCPAAGTGAGRVEAVERNPLLGQSGSRTGAGRSVGQGRRQTVGGGAIAQKRRAEQNNPRGKVKRIELPALDRKNFDRL